MNQRNILLTFLLYAFLIGMCGMELLSSYSFFVLLCAVSAAGILLPTGPTINDFIIDGAVVMSHRAGVVFNDKTCRRGIAVRGNKDPGSKETRISSNAIT